MYIYIPMEIEVLYSSDFVDDGQIGYLVAIFTPKWHLLCRVRRGILFWAQR